MLKDIITKEALLSAAYRVKAKGFKPGLDNMNITSAINWLQINGDNLCSQIYNGKYSPLPISGFTKAKRNGSYRTLGKLCAIDTIIQNALLDSITAIADSGFSDRSFAYRKNRGMTTALELYCTLANSYSYAAKIDPANCFDNISHSILEGQLNALFNDKKLTQLIISFVKAPIIIENGMVTKEKGLPQGAPLSSLLCNIYLDQVDKTLQDRAIDFIRYADDIVIFSGSGDELREYVKIVRDTLSELELSVNEQKLVISTPADIEFLGHSFTKNKYGFVAEQTESVQNIATSWTESEYKSNRRTLYVVSDGILRQKDYTLCFESDESTTEIPTSSVNCLNIFSSVVLDSGALKRAFDNGICINIFSNENHLLGRFLPNTSLREPLLLFEQLSAYYDDAKRVLLAKSFLLASFHNTRLVIRYYNKQNPLSEYQKALTTIDRIYKKLKAATNYQDMLMLEAEGRKAYYDCFDLFISNKDFIYQKRTRRPPENEVNAMISFGNTLLYNYIACEINKTALDVRVGYLHATNKRLESLNLDIAEIFKPLIVDRTIFALINRKAITTDMFIKDGRGYYLTAAGKKLFIEAFNDKMDVTLSIKGSDPNYRQLIQEEIRKLIRYIKKGEKYTPYKQVR